VPICRIQAPPGINPTAKKKMLTAITAALEEGYQKIGVTMVFLEEDNLEQVMVNGRMASEDPKYDEFRNSQVSKSSWTPALEPTADTIWSDRGHGLLNTAWEGHGWDRY
jgi:hypothetical protein